MGTLFSTERSILLRMPIALIDEIQTVYLIPLREYLSVEKCFVHDRGIPTGMPPPINPYESIPDFEFDTFSVFALPFSQIFRSLACPQVADLRV